MALSIKKRWTLRQLWRQWTQRRTAIRMSFHVSDTDCPITVDDARFRYQYLPFRRDYTKWFQFLFYNFYSRKESRHFEENIWRRRRRRKRGYQLHQCQLSGGEHTTSILISIQVLRAIIWSNLWIHFCLHILKNISKYYIPCQFWGGSVLRTLIFETVLPPLLDSKNGRDTNLGELGRVVTQQNKRG